MSPQKEIPKIDFYRYADGHWWWRTEDDYGGPYRSKASAKRVVKERFGRGYVERSYGG